MRPETEVAVLLGLAVFAAVHLVAPTLRAAVAFILMKSP